MIGHKKHSIKEKFWAILFAMGLLSIAGTTGGLEADSLSIIEAILYLFISIVPIALAVNAGVLRETEEN